MRTQGRDSGLHAQEGGFGRDQPCRTRISDFSLQDWERIDVCYLSPPVCGTLSQQPKKRARGQDVQMTPLADALSPTGQTHASGRYVAGSRSVLDEQDRLPAPQRDRREQRMGGRPLRRKATRRGCSRAGPALDSRPLVLVSTTLKMRDKRSTSKLRLLTAGKDAAHGPCVPPASHTSFHAHRGRTDRRDSGLP